MATTAHALTISHTCSACHSTNEIPVAEIATAGRCPTCKTSWRPAEPISVDEASFYAIRDSTRLPIVAAFCTARSEACRRMIPDVHELAHDLAEHAIFLKVDPEQHPQLGYDFGVDSLPCLLLLRDGQVVSRAGAAGQAELRRWLCAHIDPRGKGRVCQSAVVGLVSRCLQFVAVFAGFLFLRHPKRSQP
jgi:thiol-disulfide isomerase/thioredoxin